MNLFKALFPTMFLSKQECTDIDHLKDHFEFWYEWSGSRFVVTRNPYMDEKYYKRFYPTRVLQHKDYLKKVQLGATIQSNPVTGIWAPISKDHDNVN